MKVIDIVLIILIAAIVGKAMYSIIKKRGSGCGCGCSSCPGNGCCGKQKNK